MVNKELEINIRRLENGESLILTTKDLTQILSTYQETQKNNSEDFTIRLLTNGKWLILKG